MHKLVHLLATLEITKQMPRYGWAFSGMKEDDMDDLAQHHYAVTVFCLLVGWQLQERGVPINLEKLLTLALLHDVGELFGGDIATPLGLQNPQAKAASRMIEDTTIEFLAKLPGDQELAKKFIQACQEERGQQSLEAQIIKIIDRLEAQLHFELARQPEEYTNVDRQLFDKILYEPLDKVSDPIAKQYLKELVGETISRILDKSLRRYHFLREDA
ncbi:MAG: YfbR-like 5'-deoxynucleotidase [bacterium]